MENKEKSEYFGDGTALLGSSVLVQRLDDTASIVLQANIHNLSGKQLHEFQNQYFSLLLGNIRQTQAVPNLLRLQLIPEVVLATLKTSSPSGFLIFFSNFIFFGSCLASCLVISFFSDF